MTLTSLLINAILAAAVVYGIVYLLVHGIRSDRTAQAALAEVHHLEREVRGRIAA